MSVSSWARNESKSTDVVVFLSTGLIILDQIFFSTPLSFPSMSRNSTIGRSSVKSRFSIFKRSPKPVEDWWYECDFDTDCAVSRCLPPRPAGFRETVFDNEVKHILESASLEMKVAKMLGADVPDQPGRKPTPKGTGRRLVRSADDLFVTEVYDDDLASKSKPDGAATSIKIFQLSNYFRYDIDTGISRWTEMGTKCLQLGVLGVLCGSLQDFNTGEKVGLTKRDGMAIGHVVLFPELPVDLHPDYAAWNAAQEASEKCPPREGSESVDIEDDPSEGCVRLPVKQESDEEYSPESKVPGIAL